MSKQRSRPSKLASQLGKRIQERRLEIGLTQAALAELVDIDPETISRIERGVVLPGLLRLEQIAIALRTGVSAILASTSTVPDDQALHVSKLLQGLNEVDRLFALDYIKRFAEYRKLAAKDSSKPNRR